MSRYLQLIAAALPAVAATASAHPDVDEQILALTANIQQQPNDAWLYLRRAEVLRTHRDWPNAAADYDRAQEIDPHLNAVDLARGKMLLAAGKPAAAKAALDRFLANSPDHPDALAERARALAALGLPRLAVADLTRAVGQPAGSQPELYLQRARLQPSAGDALHGLEEGIAQLGPLPTLELAAIDCELKLNNFAAALQRLDQIMARAIRKETWLIRRAEILERAGLQAQARQAYASALSAINELPGSLRHTALVADLEQRATAALKLPE